MAEENSFLKRFFIPKYDELSIALMSAAFLMILFTNDFYDSYIVYAFAAVFSVGIILSFYHIFTRREKKKYEKDHMLVFALGINAYSGIAAGIHILFESKGFFIIFPVWNFFNAAVMMLFSSESVRGELIEEGYITDENTTFIEFLFGLAIMSALFLVCQYVFNLYWAITLSICVTYVTNFNKLLNIFNPSRTSAI